MRKTIVVAVAAAVAVALTGCGPSAPPPGPEVKPHTPRDRHALIVLVDDGAKGCLAKAPERHNAYKNDTVIWEVQNYCGAAATVEIKFTGTNPLDNPSLTSAPEGSSHRWKDIRGRVTGAEGHYPYEVWVNGAKAADPDLEIDPFSD